MRNIGKCVKRTAALCAAAAVTVGCLATASADGGEKTVSVRIEGIGGNVCDGEFRTGADTLDGLLRDADAASEAFELTITESEYGAYISSVNGEAAGAFGGYDGWLFTVNGEDPGVGISSVEINDGDIVVIYYADTFEAGFQFPEAKLERLDEGIIRFVSRDTVYDENYEASVVVNPVADMNVKWYVSDGEYREFKTDENGEAVLDKELLTEGAHRVSFDKYAENGLPLVLRSTSDYTVTVEKDTPTGTAFWAAAALTAMLAAAVLLVTAAVCRKCHEE